MYLCLSDLDIFSLYYQSTEVKAKLDRLIH